MSQIDRALRVYDRGIDPMISDPCKRLVVVDLEQLQEYIWMRRPPDRDRGPKPWPKTCGLCGEPQLADERLAALGGNVPDCIQLAHRSPRQSNDISPCRCSSYSSAASFEQKHSKFFFERADVTAKSRSIHT